jgi:DNA-binding GntR family transcriptional regulator
MSRLQESTNGRGERAYQRIASALLDEIGGGRYPVGARLPTEAQLCERFNVSRATVRAALDDIERKGMVRRRPKIGTVVTASEVKNRYAVSVGSLSDLLQFLDSTVVRPREVEDVVANKTLAAELHCEEGTKWIRVGTVRTPASESVPISWTDYYLPPRFRGVVTHFGKRVGPIYPLLERKYGIAIARIEQDIGACLLREPMAGLLSARPRAAALRVIHRMVNGDGASIYCTISVYPAERFRYVQVLTRSG